MRDTRDIPSAAGLLADAHRYDGLLLQWAQRVDLDKPLTPTPRDVEILRSLWSCKFLSTGQIHTLWWPHADLRRAQRRLGWLFHTGYVARFRPRMLRGSYPWTYMLDERGHELLSLAGLIPFERFRRHVVTDFGVVVHDLQMNGWAIAYKLLAAERLLEWRGPREATVEPPTGLDREKAAMSRLALRRPGRIVPDAGMVVELRDGALMLFVELDRTRRPDKNHQKLLRYDALLTWWWEQSELGEQCTHAPVALFLCQDENHLRSFLAAGDSALTGYSSGRYPGRGRVLFAMEADVHAGKADAWLVPESPPSVRRHRAEADAQPEATTVPGLR
jgi:hypothetical protein